MNGPIVVINPNSNPAVTDGLDTALQPFRLGGGPAIECLTLAEGPFGIESQLDSDSVVLPLVQLVRERGDAAAFVIACYSDPGIDACRSIAPQPVFGIQEAGILAAMARADRFGVIAIAEASIQRHYRYMARMQVLSRLAGEIPLDMSVDEITSADTTFDRLAEVGDRLKTQGAGAVILGCAGMARYRARLEACLGVPVIDPVQAAVAQALLAVLSR